MNPSGQKPSGQKQDVVRFGTFELDIADRELRKGGVPVKLQSQPFQLLALLVSRQRQVVSREEIRRALWGAETFVDFDQSINFCVNKLRDALDDDPQRPQCIETVPRKGYRFVAAIVEPDLESPSRENAPRRRPRWLLLAGVALALVAIALAARTAVLYRLETKPITSLAVLPLENLSHDAEQEYFADGMTDDLITDLAKISALRVISRTSVMQYKGTKKTIAQIVRELNVDAVLEGTVTRDQGRVRITAQLIQGTPERHLWADKYEGSLSDVLDLQDAVAKAVADEIQIKLTQKEQEMLTAHRAVNPAAYEMYLKGRHLWEISGEENLKRSKEYFEQAIDEDPGYALAWSGLADTYDRLASWGVLSRQEAGPRARAAAQKALELDSSLVNPLVTLAGVKMNLEWDWAGTERLCRQAIAMSPNSGEAHSAYAIYLAEVGRTEEAIAEARKAHEAEPLSDVIADNVVWNLYLARRYSEAESEWHKQFGSVPQGDYVLASVYLQEGRQREAIVELKKGAAQPWAGALELMYLGHALGITGARAEGEQVLQQMLDLTNRRYVPPEYIAIVYEGLGERDRAIQGFEKAYAERSINSWILPDPRLDNIRTDPRFKEILRRMGLSQ